mmetsp:Transcript_59485/g.118198  ORF Transcript_59485/g.118198 Transcript_59485/m.118198 type:complete len:217 (-) Transcript_59485:783-1433(-)
MRSPHFPFTFSAPLCSAFTTLSCCTLPLCRHIRYLTYPRRQSIDQPINTTSHTLSCRLLHFSAAASTSVIRGAGLSSQRRVRGGQLLHLLLECLELSRHCCRVSLSRDPLRGGCRPRGSRRWRRLGSHSNWSRRWRGLEGGGGGGGDWRRHRWGLRGSRDWHCVRHWVGRRRGHGCGHHAATHVYRLRHATSRVHRLGLTRLAARALAPLALGWCR